MCVSQGEVRHGRTAVVATGVAFGEQGCRLLSGSAEAKLQDTSNASIFGHSMVRAAA